jgi:hypothetical protein
MPDPPIPIEVHEGPELWQPSPELLDAVAELLVEHAAREEQACKVLAARKAKQNKKSSHGETTESYSSE